MVTRVENVDEFNRYVIMQNVLLINGSKKWVEVCGYKYLSQAQFEFAEFARAIGNEDDLCIIHETKTKEATE